MNITPIQFAVYKGINGKFGAVQFDLQDAHFSCSSCRAKNYTAPSHPPTDVSHPPESFSMDVREGTLFVSASSPTQGGGYDWDKKVVMALNVGDISKILYFLRTGNPGEGLRLVHDRHAGTPRKGESLSYLSLNSPRGLAQGCILSLSKKTGEDVIGPHTIPFLPTEAMALGILLQAAVPRILAWS